MIVTMLLGHLIIRKFGVLPPQSWLMLATDKGNSLLISPYNPSYPGKPEVARRPIIGPHT